MEAPDFWNDTEVSQKKMKELKSLKDAACHGRGRRGTVAAAGD